MSIQAQLNQMLLSAVGSGLAASQSPGIKNYSEYRAALKDYNLQREKTKLQDVAGTMLPEQELALAEQMQVEQLAAEKASAAKAKAGLTSPKERSKELYHEDLEHRVATETVRSVAKAVEEKRAAQRAYAERQAAIRAAILKPDKASEVKFNVK